MEYRRIPKSGLELSVIGIGSGSIHEAGEKEVRQVIDAAETAGVNLIDLAMSYPEPMPKYGAALRGRRDKFHMQMHLGMDFSSGEYGRNYSLEAVKRGLDWQMKQIGTDYADIALIHCIDSEADFDAIISNGVFDYALTLKKTGVIKNLGFASHTVSAANRFIETGAIDLFMFSVNAAYDYDPIGSDDMRATGENDDGLAIATERQALYLECRRRGIGIQVMKPYGGGKLLDANASPFGLAMTVQQCLKYALDRPAVLACVPGVRNKADLLDAVKLFEMDAANLDYSYIARLRHEGLTGSCVYCNHCMPCPSGIDIGAVNKLLDLYLAGDALAKEHYVSLETKASACMECGVCAERCPFGVDAPARMKQATEAFGNYEEATK